MPQKLQRRWSLDEDKRQGRKREKRKRGRKCSAGVGRADRSTGKKEREKRDGFREMEEERLSTHSSSFRVHF